MAYSCENFKTKKALREAIARGPVPVYQPGPFGPHVADGTCSLEGPHFPKPHRWYASVRVIDGKAVKLLT